MILPKKDSDLFSIVYLSLLYYIGDVYEILYEETDFEDFLFMEVPMKIEIRDVLLEDTDNILDEFIADSPDMSEDELSILNGIRKGIIGKFILLESLSQYSVFRSVENNKYYTVIALSEPFDQLFSSYPALLELYLIPFKGQIIYDGFIKGLRPRIEKKIEKMMLEEYEIAKQNNKIITTLD